MQALSLMRTPLPGLETPAALRPLLLWARQLLMSPRLFEADAGARIVKLISDDYVTRLGWRVTLWPQLSVEVPTAAGQRARPAGPAAAAGRVHPGAAEAALGLLRSLASKAQQQATLGADDLAAACRHGLAHGPLLAARDVCEGLSWEPMLAAATAAPFPAPAAPGAARAGAGRAPAAGAGAGGAAGMGVRGAAAAVVEQLLTVLRAVAAVALPPLSRQDRNVAAGDVDEEGIDPEEEEEEVEEEGAEEEEGEEEDEGAGDAEGLGPVPQLVNTACWTTLKEVAAVASALVCRLQLPQDGGGIGGSSDSDSGNTAAAEGGSSKTATSKQGKAAADQAAVCGGAGAPPLLSVAQVEAAGELLVELLLHLKHNGAVDKVQASFAVLCGRLLRSETPALRRLPGAWLARCLEHLLRPGALKGGGGPVLASPQRSRLSQLQCIVFVASCVLAAAQGSIPALARCLGLRHPALTPLTPLALNPDQGLDDIVRRSAGLPFAILALFLAEPPGTPPRLLPEGMARLLATAQDDGLEPWPRVRVCY
jgi:hypothetical protein